MTARNFCYIWKNFTHRDIENNFQGGRTSGNSHSKKKSADMADNRAPGERPPLITRHKSLRGIG